MNLVWSNGRIGREEECRISPLDRGFTLGDGLFETIRADGAKPLWLAEHLDRLAEGAKVLGLSLPFPRSAIESGIADLLKAAEFPQSALRLTLTRGRSEKRGLWPPSNPDGAMIVITLAALPTFTAQRVIVASSTRRNEHSPLSRMKSLNYGDNLLAKREAIGRGATDAIMLNGAGIIACATAGNIFLRLGGRWATPALTDGVLPGLARKRLIETLEARVVSLPISALVEADAALVSNSLGCSVVSELDDRKLEAIERSRLEAIYR